MKKLNFETKELIVKLAGNCFWYWNSFHAFLRNCNVPESLIRRYPKDSHNKYDVMRNIIHDLDNKNNIDIIQSIISEFYRLTKPVDNDVKDPDGAKLLLVEFKTHVGSDPIELEIEKRNKSRRRKEYLEKVSDHQERMKALETLKEKFYAMSVDESLTPQQRGYRLEPIFYELLELEEFKYRKPYKIATEQIDGSFKFGSFDYLVEIKFQVGLIKKDDLSIFDNKIRGKAQSTRGFFFAPNSFDKEHVKAFEGNSPRIILMDVNDWISVLENKHTFYDILSKKEDQLVKTGAIYY